MIAQSHYFLTAKLRDLVVKISLHLIDFNLLQIPRGNHSEKLKCVFIQTARFWKSKTNITSFFFFNQSSVTIRYCRLRLNSACCSDWLLKWKVKNPKQIQEEWEGDTSDFHSGRWLWPVACFDSHIRLPLFECSFVTSLELRRRVFLYWTLTSAEKGWRKTQRTILHPLVHSPNDCNNQS